MNEIFFLMLMENYRYYKNFSKPLNGSILKLLKVKIEKVLACIVI